jgi:glycosyl transferase family 25
MLQMPFDRIYWINAKTATARHILMQRYFDKVGLTDRHGNKPERVQANVGKWVPQKVDDSKRKNRLSQSEIGCYASHYIIWKEIAQSEIGTGLILEDDCRFDLPKLEGILANWTAMPDFEFLNFCCYNYRQVPIEKKVIHPATGLVQGYGYWLTHCYGLSKSGATKLVDLMAVQTNGLDHQLAMDAQKHLRTFAFAGNPAFQIKLSSQINHTNP